MKRYIVSPPAVHPTKSYREMTQQPKPMQTTAASYVASPSQVSPPKPPQVDIEKEILSYLPATDVGLAMNFTLDCSYEVCQQLERVLTRMINHKKIQVLNYKDTDSNINRYGNLYLPVNWDIILPK